MKRPLSSRRLKGMAPSTHPPAGYLGPPAPVGDAERRQEPARASGEADPCPLSHDQIQYEVHKLATQEHARRLAIECGILGRLPIGEICAAACVTNEVLEAFETRHFDVRRHLNQRTWVHLNAIRDPNPLVETIRRLSFDGGPGFVRALIPVLPKLLSCPEPGDGQEAGDGGKELVTQIRRIVAIETSNPTTRDVEAGFRLSLMPARGRVSKKKFATALASVWSSVPGIKLRFPPDDDDRGQKTA